MTVGAEQDLLDSKAKTEQLSELFRPTLSLILTSISETARINPKQVWLY